MDSLGVYVHIPFCVQKCAYCDFLSAPATREKQQAYVEALKKEIACESSGYAAYEVRTIFFGGGTPSILEAEDIEGILDCIRACYRLGSDAEITLEMNPGTATRDKLIALKKAGINRLSIGLQSADDAELQMLGRIHTYEDFLKTYHDARENGFDNINIDLMSALPGQSMDSWVQTLEKVMALEPEHLSAYSLIIEEGTRLYDRLSDYPPVPDEDEDRRMYQETKRILAAHGYHRYEISNYARAGRECRHNMIYWQRGADHIADYAGFGLGAASTVKNMRWKNTDDMEKYLQTFSNGKGKGIKEEFERLSTNDCMAEFVFLGLRMMCGVSKSEFQKSFGQNMDDVYGAVIQKWIRQGMLVQQGDYIMLTDAGIDVSNVVLADFLLA